MKNEVPGGPLGSILKWTANIERNELPAVLLSFLFVFVLMTAYSILKPVRDALGGDFGNVGLSVAWTANFVLSVVAVSAYGALLSFVRFRIAVPAVYAFFALTFLALYVATTQLESPVLINQGFYVWVSVFSLFHLSVFWSFMADLFDKTRAPRLFGFIAAGTSAGALAGPAITSLLVDVIGAKTLILVSSGLLLIPIPIILVLERLRTSSLHTQHQQTDLSKQIAMGRNPFAGFSMFLTSRYLLMIGVFIVLYVTINTFVYFELQHLTGDYGLNTRTKIWAFIEIGTNVLTLLTAVFLTSRIVLKLGMRAALAMMPALVAAGVLVLLASPTLLVLAVFQVLRRVGNYAITRPSREMLFTIIGREARFKAKPVIDIVLYRGGDMLTAWMFTLLSTTLGIGLSGIAVVISVVAALWALVALYLGKAYESDAVDSHARPPRELADGA
jgi:ATP:ADP antiporter, AAA family